MFHKRAERIVLPELHHGVRPLGAMRVGEADRLHRPVAQRLAAALGHHLDGQAAFEIGRRRFPILERGLLAGDQRVDEGVVLRLVERAVDVVGAAAAGTFLVVARLQPAHAHVDRCRDARSARWRRRRRARLRRSAPARRCASAGEVRGPVATMTLSQSAGGSPSISSRDDRDQRMSLRALRVTSPAKPSRSTASAPPAGSLWRSAAARISEPARRISSCSRPTALLAQSSERNEFEQTSSAKRAGLVRLGLAYRAHLVQHHRHAG